MNSPQRHRGTEFLSLAENKGSVPLWCDIPFAPTYSLMATKVGVWRSQTLLEGHQS